MIGASVIFLASTGLWWIHRGVPAIRIAVLPLDNLSHDPGADYFADGLTGEIITNLSQIAGLTVRSGTSSFTLKGKRPKVRDAGAQLQADYILEGSVLRDAERLRVNVRLVRARDDSPLWAHIYDRELTDIFAIQDEISRQIVINLRLHLEEGKPRYQSSIEAYDLYLRARALPLEHGPQGTVESIGPFEQAIAKDPSFAPAYAGLAAAYAFRSSVFRFDHPPDELAKMRAAAEKAISLDPLLPEAHEALAMVLARDGQWARAEKRFQRAIELDSNRADTHAHYAVWLLMVLSRIDDAIRELVRAENLDPLSPQAQQGLAFVLISAGRYDEALDHCRKMSAENPMRLQFTARARMGQGKFDEAIMLLTKDPDPTNNDGHLGYAYARSGRRQEAERLAAANTSRANQQALIYAGLGEKERTLEALERMGPQGPGRIGQYLTYPELSLLRGDPRLPALRKRVGLPE